MKKTTALVLALCIAMMLTMTACGDRATSTVPTTHTATATTTTATTTTATTIATTAATTASSAVSLEGKYVISAMMIGDEDFLEMMKALATLMGGEEFDLEDMMYFEFSGADTFTVFEDGEEETGTYKLDGKNISITIDDETMTGTVDGSSFTLEQEEDGEMVTMTFTKK